MLTALTPPGLLAYLSARGFTVRAVAGVISVTPASALAREDRDAIREHRAGLLAILSSAKAWNTGTAIGLMEEADELVERLGVDGRHPAVARAAAAVCGAYAARDTDTVRLVCREFEAVVRALAASRVKPPAAPPTT